MQHSLLILAIAFAGSAVWLLTRRMRVRRQGKVADGVVVEYKRLENDGSPEYRPVVTFNDQHGYTHRFTSSVGSGSEDFSIGTRIEVRYLPSRPDLAYIGTPKHLWTLPVALLLFGVICSVWWLKS